jgi:hypothetical protein
MTLPDNRIRLPSPLIDFTGDVGDTGKAHDSFPEAGPARFDHMRMFLIGLLANQASFQEPIEFRLGSWWFDLNSGIFKYRADEGATIDTDGANWVSLANAIELMDGLTLQQWYDQIKDTIEAVPVAVDGVEETYIAGATIDTGNIVRKNATPDEVELADASALSTSDDTVGVAVSSATATNNITIANAGVRTVRAETTISITAGDKVFLATAAGRVTNVEPSISGTVKYVLGFAKTSTDAPGGTCKMAWIPRTPEVNP